MKKANIRDIPYKAEVIEIKNLVLDSKKDKELHPKLVKYVRLNALTRALNMLSKRVDYYEEATIEQLLDTLFFTTTTHENKDLEIIHCGTDNTSKIISFLGFIVPFVKEPGHVILRLKDDLYMLSWHDYKLYYTPGKMHKHFSHTKRTMV